jgi:geranylgeranyl diphosphate synthase type II
MDHRAAEARAALPGDRQKKARIAHAVRTVSSSGMKDDVHALLEAGAAATDAALERLLPRATAVPASIHAAIRHSTFAGGKRLRPVLAIEAAHAVAATISGAKIAPRGADELGAALEMLHTYSLVHDDLPSLDNDELRRGKPTCHVVYGEAIAILAGDALQTHAYRVLAGLPCPPAATVAIIRAIAEATGTEDGMIGGQVLDLEGEGENTSPTPASVEAIHRAKTGALIRVSVVSGGLLAGATPQQTAQLSEFGRKAGLAFQIVDDILDMTQSSEQLGKTAGKDLASEKATWPAVFGIEQSHRDAARLIQEAFAALEPFGVHAAGLKAIASYLVERTH